MSISNGRINNMHYSKIALAATPVFAAYANAGYGNAIVKNSCGDAAYFWSCGDSEGQLVVIGPGSSHSEAYYTKSGGGGPSLKIASSYASGPKMGQAPASIYDLPQPNITQFEYTVGSPGPPANMVWYDISNINGYPFVNGGLKMTSSDGSVNVACPKDVQYCQSAYNAPHDDHATGSAPQSVDLTMELCSDDPGVMAGGGDGGSSGGGETSAPESSAAAPAPAPSSTPPTSSTSPSLGDGKPQEKVAVQAPVSTPVSTPSTTPAPSAPAPKEAPEEDVIVYVTTTAAPEIVTVHAMAPAPKEKRHDHVHQHAHQKINKKRHGNN